MSIEEQPTPALVEARSLCAGYEDRVVVRDASFRMQAGLLLVVLGPNGCGKTTLLKTCIGLLPSLSGHTSLGELPVASMDARRRARMAAWVPQSAEAIWSYRSRDIIAQGRYSIRGPFAPFDHTDEAAIDRAIDAMDISAFVDRPISSLSGGEARRVLIARALAQDTPLLVLDEPAAHLDPGRQMELMELLVTLARSGKAVMISAHDVNAARRFADMVLLVSGNGVSVFGEPDDILTPDRLEDAYDTHFIHGSHVDYGNYVLPVSRRHRKDS
jgi:iron complex transport system ATP-binding protein